MVLKREPARHPRIPAGKASGSSITTQARKHRREDWQGSQGCGMQALVGYSLNWDTTAGFLIRSDKIKFCILRCDCHYCGENRMKDSAKGDKLGCCCRSEKVESRVSSQWDPARRAY